MTNQYPGPAEVTKAEIAWHVDRTGSRPWDTTPIHPRDAWQFRSTEGDPNLPMALAMGYEVRMALGEVVTALRLVVGDRALAGPPSNAEMTAAENMLPLLPPEKLTCFGVVLDSVRHLVEAPRTLEP